mmetsp:Transcript_77322/g.226757  ORF Transcript_77322/g.226757 Transcript_77322/m.226757 type:complete len:229 (+) Transcript_77322:473-1159(+)
MDLRHGQDMGVLQRRKQVRPRVDHRVTHQRGTVAPRPRHHAHGAAAVDLLARLVHLEDVLQVHRLDPRKAPELFQLIDAKVRHAQGPNPAHVMKCLHALPDRPQLLALDAGRVHHIDVHVVRLQGLELRGEDTVKVLRGLHAQGDAGRLRRDEELLARHPAVRHGAAYLRLVAVGLGGVNVPDAQLQCPPHCVVARLALQLPGSEAQGRHLHAIRQRQGHQAHRCLPI